MWLNVGKYFCVLVALSEMADKYGFGLRVHSNALYGTVCGLQIAHSC